MIVGTLFLEIILVSNQFSGLTFIAFLGSVFTIFLGAITVFEFPMYLNIYKKTHNDYGKNINWWNIESFDVFVKALCVYFYSFAYHGGSLIIIKNFKVKSEKRIKSVLKSAVLISFIVYYIVMLLGYLSNLEETKEIFINRDNETIFITIGKILYSLSLIFNISFTYVLSQKFMEYILTFGNDNLISEKSYYF